MFEEALEKTGLYLPKGVNISKSCREPLVILFLPQSVLDWCLVIVRRYEGRRLLSNICHDGLRADCRGQCRVYWAAGQTNNMDLLLLSLSVLSVSLALAWGFYYSQFFHGEDLALQVDINRKLWKKSKRKQKVSLINHFLFLCMWSYQ